MIKRKAAYALVGGLLITGLAFNAPAMATYVQNFKATQTIKSATWNVEFGSNLGEHTIFPGDTVGNDTITLKNTNDYAVMYTINLIETGDELKDKLTLDLLKNGDSTGIKLSGNSIGFLVKAGDTVELTSKVSWEDKENAFTYQGQSVTYKYDINAEAKKDIENIVEPTSQTELQEALDNLKPNTLINLSSATPVTYKIGIAGSKNLLINQPGVQIVGNGNVTIRPENPTNGSIQSTVKVTADNVVIDGINIARHDNKAMEVTGDNVKIRNCNIDGNLYIGSTNIESFLVEDNTLTTITIAGGAGTNGTKSQRIIRNNEINMNDTSNSMGHVNAIAFVGKTHSGWDKHCPGENALEVTVEGNTIRHQKLDDYGAFIRFTCMVDGYKTDTTDGLHNQSELLVKLGTMIENNTFLSSEGTELKQSNIEAKKYTGSSMGIFIKE